MADIGFKDPDGQRWLLIGSHTSTVRVGEQPKKRDNCPGCGTKGKVAA